MLISSGRQRSRRSTGKIGFYRYSRLDIISSTSVLRICLCLRRLRSTEDVERAGRSLCPTLYRHDAVNLFLAR